MRVQCPQCRFEGNIRDDLIPEGGRTVACPKCKKTFIVQKGGGAAGAPAAYSRAADHGRPAAAIPQRAGHAAAKTSPFLIAITAVFFLGLGFYAGYEYRGFTGGKLSPLTAIEKTKKAPKKSPPGTEPKDDRPSVMTPMGTPKTGVSPDGAERARESVSETSLTVDDLLEIISPMTRGQARHFCSTTAAEVTGSGTIREIKKTSADGGIIGAYSISIEYSADTWVVVNAKTTESYLSNFTVGSGASFIGILAEYRVSSKRKAIYLDDGMIVVK